MLANIVLLLLTAKHINSFENLENRPVIYTKDGNLNIQVAEGNHIRFAVPNNGKLYLNTRDLTEIVDSAQASLDMLQVYKIQSNTALQKLSDIENRIDGSQGMYNRIIILEKMTNNSLTSGTYIRFIRRRVNNIQKRLNTLLRTLQENECKKYPCKNGGTCQDMYNSYSCICPDTWQGPNCEIDVDECKKFANTELGCQNGATCVNKPGSYECQCAPGWYGLHCTKQTVQCNDSFEMCGHGICVPQTKGYKCICNQGWKADDKSPACIVDVDECNSYHPPCSSNPPVRCINLPGTFYCGQCPFGYTGNGFYCNDINECDIMNGGCSMSPMVQCVNTPGSRICGLCPPGYIGNGISCSYQGGVCGINNGGCHPLAQCRDNSRISASYVECVCPEGYSGNGFGPNGCAPGAKDACLPNPCLHGTCTHDVNHSGYKCFCDSKYTGTNCNIRKNACDSNPCHNGGTCVNLQLSFTCVCPANLMGTYCQIPRQNCGFLTGPSGTVSYPPEGMVFSETMQISCAWKIKVKSNKVVHVTFHSVYIPQCTHNFLQIHDGRDTTYPLIGRFCESKLKNGTVIKSTTDQLYLWFRGDGRAPKPQIEMTWNTTDPVCGDSLQINGTGTFKSPGSPNNYPSNRDCYWKFTAPIGKRIKFTFYHVDLGNFSDCTKDTLRFYENIEGGKLFYSLCSTSLPEPIYSPTNAVQVHLHTIETHTGFLIHYSLMDGIDGCGAIYTQNRGTISSPKLYHNIESNVACVFKIQLPTASRLKFTFTSWNKIGTSGGDCRDHFVALYTGKASLIAKFCGENIPSPVITFESDIIIRYKDDWKDPGSFSISYSTVCGGNYVAKSGTLVSPKDLSPGDLPMTCVYKIVRPEGSMISLEVHQFYLNDIKDNEGCSKGYLLVQDGSSKNAKTIGKYCDRIPDEDIVFPSNSLLITFFVNDVAGTGLLLSYDTENYEECGGTLYNKLGSIVTPEILGTNSAGMNCTWILKAPANHVIQIAWVRFNLEKSFKCTFAYVRVIDNATIPGSVIANYCGNSLPPDMVTTSNLATVQFKIDSSTSDGGFMLTYRYIHVDSICGGKYFSPSGLIKSPKYPANYSPNTNCFWTITVNPGEQIMLNVTKFQLEKYYNCRYDYLQIRNGGTSASPLIGKYCGDKIPKVIYSHTNQLYLQFVSDYLHSAPGFLIEWSSAATGCGGSLSAPMGIIISPHYPEPYSKNSECFWKIDISAGSKIQFIFADLDLEPHSKCLLDYVEIFDGVATTSKTLGKYCSLRNGQLSIINTNSNHATIKFRSDLSYQGRGFQLQYTTLCKTNATGFGGVIESLNFPNGYPQDVDCLWQIEVPNGNSINISFSHFELTPSSSFATFEDKKCKLDFLQILYQGEDANQMYLEGTYCNSNRPTSKAIASKLVQIKFVSHYLRSGPGFRLEWVLNGCGGIRRRPNGTISSPNYPKFYPTNTVCEWLIQTEFDQSIQITFEDVQMEVRSNCEYDNVEVFNGADAKSQSIAKFCASIDKPIIVTGSGPNMFVRFSSDISNKGRGFTANYNSIDSKCGGTLTSPSGSIHSPNYPQNYNKNDSCYWLIEVSENHLIELTVNDLDFLKSCEINYLKIFDGPTEAYPLLATLCGTEKPSKPFKSKTNHFYLEMITHNFITTKGFSATYDTACGARIKTQSSGVIEYSSNHVITGKEENCSWTLISERPDQHIFLTFTNLENLYCSFTGVSVYDGEDNNGTLIGSYCESLPPRIKSAGSMLHIENQNYFKFNATYSVLDSACGGTFYHKQGLFSTPNYPDSYPVNTECEWIIYIAPGNQVTLNFRVFDITQSEACNEDYVEIRETNKTGKFLGVFCGNDFPSNLTVNSSLWLYFKSDQPDKGAVAETGKGFLAEYTLVHGIELFGHSGQIGSPGYPKFLDNQERFTWKITVKTRNFIKIRFLDFLMDVYDPEFCYGYNFVIYDGPDETSTKLFDYCGQDLPKMIITNSNVATVVFSPVTMDLKSQFLLEWKEITSVDKSLSDIYKCGDEDTYEIETGGSQNISIMYNSSVKICSWTFLSSPGRHLKVNFISIDMNSMFRCTIGDKVRILSARPNVENPRQPEHFELKYVVCNRTSIGKSYETSNGLLLKYSKFASNFSWNRNTSSGFNATVSDACGGMIRNQGIITVDNSTDKFPKGTSLECEWKISVRNGRNVQLQFLNFTVDNKDESCSSYILVRNGHSISSPPLGSGKYCNGPIVDLIANGNTAYLKYKTSSINNRFLFRVSEESANCGGSIVLSKDYPTASITSPNYPNAANPHIECIWVVSVPNGEAVKINFVERFDLVQSTDCTIDYVEIRDGATEYSQSLGKFCSNLPSTQVTYENMMYVKYYTDTDIPRNGFKAEVSIATCGGLIRDSEGTIKSPGFMQASSYPTNIDCKWEIEVSKNKVIKLNFDKIDLPGLASFVVNDNKTNCTSTDFENVRITEIDIFTRNETSLGTFCGRKQIPPIISSGNKVFVYFKTNKRKDNFISFKGFKLTFTAQERECGGTLETPSGVITSPGYPLVNIMTLHCEWTIKVAKERRVTLTFEDVDFIKKDADSQGVVCFRGHPYTAEVLFISRDGNFTTPRIVRSSDNVMSVYYWSSGADTHRGFKATYHSDEPSVCGGELDDVSGIIVSPQEPTYTCQWALKTPMHGKQTFVLEVKSTFKNPSNQSSCTFSTSRIVIMHSWMGELAYICQETVEPVIIRSILPNPQIMATLKKSENSMNFTIKYKQYKCGGEVLTNSGYIASTSGEFECAWKLSGFFGDKFTLTPITFNLQDCEKSYLTVYNGPSTKSPTLGKFCGNKALGKIVSQENYLWIEYHGNSASSFNISFERSIEACGGILNDKPSTSSFIMSPQYPKNYDNNVECLWEINAKSGYHISLQFVDRFQLEETTNCDKDFVSIYEDPNLESNATKFCGRHVPTSFNSTSNRLFVLFRSNERITGTGFKASWSWTCGGVFTATEDLQFITSPGYPDKYGGNLSCIYTIQSAHKPIIIDFIDFELEKDDLCTYDKVTVVNGIGYGAKHTFCGKTLPPVIWMMNVVKIEFRTDRWVAYKGFRLSYRVNNCGGSITNSQEIDFTLTTAQLNRDAIVCKWNITAPEHQRINIQFLRVNMSQYYCFNHFLSVSDKNGLLANICGSLTQADSLPTIFSNTNNVTIMFYSSGYLKRPVLDFLAVVEFTYGPEKGCGGLLTATSTEITKSFIVPGPNYDCIWKIQSEPDSIIEISFVKNKSPGPKCSTDCCINYRLLDGNNTQSLEIINDCFVNSASSKYYSSSNALQLRIKGSDPKYVPLDFKITSIPSICGSSELKATDKPQILSTPNYPATYPTEIRCVWKIKTNYLNKILIKFIDFDLNRQLVNVSSCNDWDRLEIIDKGNKAFHLGYDLIWKKKPTSYELNRFNSLYGSHTFCSPSDKDYEYMSPNDLIQLSFFSNNLPKKGNGFKLEYQIATCSRNYTSLQGTISKLWHSGNCSIYIIVPIDYTISLFFSGLDAFYGDCSKRYLEIYDGDPSKERLLKACNQTLSKPVFSTGNQLYIKLNNLMKYALKTYTVEMTYTSVNKKHGRGCGGQFYSFKGSFTSPLYPVPFTKNAVCEWNIKVPAGLQAALRFTFFDLEGDCNDNYVKIWNSFILESTGVTHCPGTTPAVYISVDNTINVKYVTSSSNTGTGWNAKFMAITSDLDYTAFASAEMNRTFIPRI